ncbi:hypothetical protein [Arachidicoccus terrestris]|uniref:hypothetical protein n=1 Tax=Arachidicoccus terrestris TaxID=2875539 RepID=UPI001CC4CE2C|nr:hypothetical protein [Arachidicoccus terrestris]UAY56251.1 hypothetical protein K9M52_04325 [Arachidicoccus terrestris]
MKEPFTVDERIVMDLIVKAHNSFLALPRSHPAELTEWINHLHGLQDVLGRRVLCRDYPNYFNGGKELTTKEC